MTEYQTAKVLCISMCHLSEDTCCFLYNHDVERYGRSGFFLYSGMYADKDSQDLLNIINLAKKLDCTYILMDYGFPVYQELETFEDW